MKAQLLQDYVLTISTKRRYSSRPKPLRKEEFHGTTMVRLIDAASLSVSKDLEQSIRRHCDGVGEIHIHPTVALEVCEYCREPWTGSTTYYNGGCCAKDEEHNPMPLLGPTRAQKETE